MTLSISLTLQQRTFFKQQIDTITKVQRLLKYREHITVMCSTLIGNNYNENTYT